MDKYNGKNSVHCKGSKFIYLSRRMIHFPLKLPTFDYIYSFVHLLHLISLKTIPMSYKTLNQNKINQTKLQTNKQTNRNPQWCRYGVFIFITTLISRFNQQVFPEYLFSSQMSLRADISRTSLPAGSILHRKSWGCVTRCSVNINPKFYK